MKFDKKTQLSIAYAILTLLLLLSLQNYFSTQVENVPYSQFRHWVQDGQVESSMAVTCRGGAPAPN